MAAEVWSALSSPKPTPLPMTAGRMSPSLIRAYRQVADKHPDWHLEIYGEGFRKSELLDLTASLGLEDFITFKGNAKDIDQRLRSASIHVLPSQTEGFPLVLIEAMTSGVPSVAYDCPYGPSDMIKDGESGFLVPLNDEAALAEKINLLIENPALRKELGFQAQIQSRRFSKQAVMDMWLKLFENMC